MNTDAALKFLIDVIFDSYAFIVLARLIMQLVRADFYNPISQFTIRATNPLLVPLRRIIPGIGGIDLASIILLLAIVLIKVLLLSTVLTGSLPNMIVLLFVTARECLSLVLGFFTYAIFLQVIISWIAGQSYSSAIQMLHQITEPLMRPVRRFLPPMGGLDFAPMIVLVALSFVRILLSTQS